MKKDLNIKNEELQITFNFRVAALIINDGKILLQKSDNVDYWVFEGGRVMFGEDTKSALAREIKEETGVTLDKNDFKLIRVIENFFPIDGTRYHELLFVYLVKDIKELNKMDNFKTLDNELQINKWIDISELNNLKIQPKIIKDVINDLEFKLELVNNN